MLQMKAIQFHLVRPENILISEALQLKLHFSFSWPLRSPGLLCLFTFQKHNQLIRSSYYELCSRYDQTPVNTQNQTFCMSAVWFHALESTNQQQPVQRIWLFSSKAALPDVASVFTCRSCHFIKYTSKIH